MSQRISLTSQTEASKYEANAVQLEQWACALTLTRTRELKPNT